MIVCRLSEKTVEDILERGSIYEVGGAVRDRLLGMPSPVIKDRDYLVTGIAYDELTRILRKHGRVDLVGRSFGVIKFTQYRANRNYTFDITLPRREHSTGVAHTDFKVDFDPDLKVEDDLVRRDFTVNAMAVDLNSEKIIDPLGGRLDIERRQLRMTSSSSFQEDPLRMLRAVQLSARFKFILEPETFKAMCEQADLINSVSAERITEELNKLLVRAEKPSGGFRLMQSSGLLKQILPELEACVGVNQPGGYHRYDVFEHTIRTVDAAPDRLRIRLAALFHDIRKPQSRKLTNDGATFYGHEVSGARTARDIMNRLRMPKDLAREVGVLVERHMFTTDVGDKGLRRLIRKVGKDLIFDLLDLRRADVVAQGMGGTTEDVDELQSAIESELERKPPFSYTDLAINGNDIMSLLDVPPGPLIGRILNHLLELALDNPAVNTREELIRLAREHHATIIENEHRGSHKEDNP
jgi:tRNA nucleotidyltransferase (CCA-adding enzyme)